MCTFTVMPRQRGIGAMTVVCCLAAIPAPVAAHSGPPYPIVSSATVGPYVISVWTDPDTTDDGTPGGQFWVVFEGDGAADLPDGTRATVAVQPADRTGAEQTAVSEPVRGDRANQFAAVVMDHEGPFSVNVVVDGPLGRAAVDSRVDATYDLRPPPALLALYVAPFVAVAFLWGKMLRKRRRFSRTPPSATPPSSSPPSRT